MADNQFRPYKYIKEFYNPERLIMPSLRRHVLLHLFVGEADTPGETLLDNMNYKFFDLWTLCINKYRYSFWETARAELLVVPDMMSCVPPFCNVIFPDEYIHYDRSVKLEIPTRFFEQGFTTTAHQDDPTGLSIKEQWSQEAYVAPTSDIEPLMAQIIKAELAGIELEKSGEDTKFVSYRQIPLPEELHYGANYYSDEEGEYLFRMGEDFDAQTEAFGQTSEASVTLREEYTSYHKQNVMYKYFLTRLQSQKTEQVTLTFTPRLVPGLPVLLLSKTGRHLFGLLTSLQHRISAEGEATTQCVIEYQYLYDDQTKRPLYLLRDRNPKLKMGEDDDYIWKNYFMLSNEFRDKYIGEYMYSTIMTDEIDSLDYNPYAKKLSAEKDKSILLANKIFGKKIKKKTDAGNNFEELKAALENTKQVGQEDDYYYSQYAPNSSREVFLQQVDAAISVNKDDKQLVSQMYDLYSAVGNIDGAYKSAFSKDQFKKQFDIYPLRDFDTHMASLGAERDNEGNFKGVGAKVDWVAKIKEEIQQRLKSYNNQQNKETEKENKVKEEEKQKKKTKVDDAINTAINHIKTNNFGDLTRDDIINYIEYREGIFQNIENVRVFEKLGRSKEKMDGLNALYDGPIKQYISSLGLEPKLILEDRLIEKDVKQEKPSTVAPIDNTSTDRTPNYERLKDSQDKEKNLKRLKGEIVDANRKKELDKLFKLNTLDKKTSQLDGFTTQGPFCLEKQLYFREIFKKSITHFDTEFRDVATENKNSIKRKKANDRTELEDILKMTHTKGSMKVNFETTNNEINNPSNNTEPNKQTTNEINRIFSELVDLKIQALKVISSEAFVMHDFNNNTISFNLAAYSTSLTNKLIQDGLGEKKEKSQDRYWLEWTTNNSKLESLKRELSDEHRGSGQFYDEILEYVCSRKYVYENGSFIICKKFLDKLNEFYSKKGYTTINITEELR